MKGPQ